MHIMHMKSMVAAALLACGLLIPGGTRATIVLMLDRVIYSEAAGEKVLQLNQAGKIPGLVQVWLDEGDVGADPGSVQVPFVLTPAVARINPGQGQAVRILRTGGDLPKDRESLFWLNILEVLPQTAAALDPEQNQMRLSFRMRLKFFYRPSGLRPARREAPDLLQFTLAPVGADGRAQVRVYNPTPYYLVVQRVDLHRAGDAVAPALAGVDFTALDVTGDILPPMAERLLPLTLPSGIERLSLPADVDVVWETFNDQGFTEPSRRRLER